MGLLRPNGFEIILEVIFTPVFGCYLNFWKNYSKTIFDKKKLLTF